ncbi:MAG: cyclic nucleotide-binding domain-containing protein, partial [Verrucomicrobiaceae bacterium]
MKISPDVLKPHPFFALFPYRTLKRLAADSAVAEYPKGATVFKAGDRCDAVYVIISGRCESLTAGRNGGTMVEAVFGPGDLLGERAFFHAEPHAATIRVVTRCVLLRIPVEELDALFANDFKLAARFSQLLAKRWSVMGTRQPERGSRVRRVVSLLSLNQGLDSRATVEDLATALSAISHQQVLLIHLTREDSAEVHEWAKHDHCLDGEFRFNRQVRSIGTGYCEMHLPVSNDPAYAAAVAPLISHCGRHYDYVLLHGDANLPERTAREAVLQADLAYILLKPNGPDMAQFDLLVRSLEDSTDYATRHLRPVVVSDDPERSARCEATLKRSAHLPGHAINHFPSSNSGSDADRRGALCVNRMAREIARCRIGLALSSGGAKGLAHVGVIQILEENGIEIDAIAGASMGAYVGSLWALGLDGTELERLAREYEGRGGLRSMLDPVFPPRLGFIRTRHIAKRLRNSLGNIPFAGLVRPMRVVATHLDTLGRIVFEDGEVASAVEASIA